MKLFLPFSILDLNSLKRFFLIAIFLLAFISVKGQNALVGSGFSSGWGGGGCPTGSANFKFLANNAGGTFGLTTTANGTRDQFFRFGVDWSGTTAQLTKTIGSDELVIPNTTYSLNTSCTTNGAMKINVPNASYNYVFKTLNAGTNPAGTFVFFEVQGAIRTVSTVAQSPLANSVTECYATTITAALSGDLSAGQAVYLRYTKDGYSNSTVVKLTGSGTTYTATIPSSFNTAGATISYYLFSSGDSNVAANGSNADLYTINLNNIGGSNYSYTVSPGSLPTITQQPLAATVCTGSNVSFNVKAIGGILNYQWKKGSENISGANSATLLLTNVSTADASNYSCEVKAGTCEPITSTVVSLTVNTAPTISYSGVSSSYTIGTAIAALTPVNIGGTITTSNANQTTTIGSGFNYPWGVAVDASGSIYVGDYGVDTVYKMSADGLVRTSIGSGFVSPAGVAVDVLGNVFVADSDNNEIKKIATDNTVTTLGIGFTQPFGVAVDNSGNVYVADYGNNAIKKIAADNSVTNTLGSGFSLPYGVAVDTLGNVYLSNSGSNMVEKIAPNNSVSQLGSPIDGPLGVAVDAMGNIFVCAYNDDIPGNGEIKKIAPNNTMTTLSTGFYGPYGVAVDNLGNVYVADSGNGEIKKIVPSNEYSISPSLPTGLVFDTLTGIISGTPSTTSPSITYTISIQNSCAFNSTTITFSTIEPVTTWNGSVWSNGNPDLNTEAIIAGTYTTTANGTFTAKKVTVNSGSLTVNTGTNLTIANEVINNAGANAIVIESNANLIQTNNVTNTDAITVKRNSNPLYRLDYTLWSSPVTGAQTLENFSPLTSQTPTSRFYIYDYTLGTTGLYASVLPTTQFATGTGYLIRMPNEDPANLGTSTPYYLGNSTLTYNGVFTGVPNNGTITLGISTPLVSDEYYAVGNPYPSAISANAFINGNSTEGTLYFWRKKNAEIGSAYATYNLVGTTVTAASSGNGSGVPDGTIAVGQGFIVKTGAAATTLNFTNTMRTSNNSAQFFKNKQVAQKDRVWLNLTNTLGVFSQALVGYMDGATFGVDNGIDGKYINDSPIALTSSINNEEYTIQGRPAFDVADVVALNFKTESAGDYTIAIDHSEGVFASGQDIYLVDSKTGAETNLKTSPYNFTATTGVDNTRFSLKYQKTLKVDDAIFSENDVTVYAKNGTLYVNSGAVAISTIQVYDVQGRLIAERKNVKATTATLENLKANNQVLLVKVSGENNQVVIKKVMN